MVIVSSNRCASSGAERYNNAPMGLCPRCLLRSGLPSRPGGADSVMASRSSVLEELTVSVGPMPRVLLDSVDGSSTGEPIVRPNSDAMPPTSERSERLRLLGELARGGMGGGPQRSGRRPRP